MNTGVQSRALKPIPVNSNIARPVAPPSKIPAEKVIGRQQSLDAKQAGASTQTLPLRRQNALPVREKNGKQPEALQRVATRSTVPLCKRQTLASQRTNAAFELGEHLPPAPATFKNRFGFRKAQGKFTLPTASAVEKL